MARRCARPEPEAERVLRPRRRQCPACGRRMALKYDNDRTVVSLRGLVRYRLKIRRCEKRACARFHRPYRPEREGRIALPQPEFGLDVVALVGALRYREHRSVPEIHRTLRDRGVAICQRSVTNLLDRYDELVTTAAGDPRRRAILKQQKRVILAIDGLQPDAGHEVLWVIRDCLSGHVLMARSLLSVASDDVAARLSEVVEHLEVPIVGVVSDGQPSIRLAVKRVLPEVPHQLCQFHYLREAALPIYEADRHAKKELKKQIRTIRSLERHVAGREDVESQVVQGYCAAVRSALTDDGPPPLEAAGLRLHGRLETIAASLARLDQQGG